MLRGRTLTLPSASGSTPRSIGASTRACWLVATCVSTSTLPNTSGETPRTFLLDAMMPASRAWSGIVRRLLLLKT